MSVWSHRKDDENVRDERMCESDWLFFNCLQDACYIGCSVNTRAPDFSFRGRAAHPIMLSEAHFFLLWSHGPNVLPPVAKCSASLCRAHPTTNRLPDGLGRPPIGSLQWNNDQACDLVFGLIGSNQWSVPRTSNQSDVCDWSGDLIPLIVIGRLPTDLWASRWQSQCSWESAHSSWGVQALRAVLVLSAIGLKLMVYCGLWWLA